jgi:hypothetical protein
MGKLNETTIIHSDTRLVEWIKNIWQKNQHILFFPIES